MTNHKALEAFEVVDKLDSFIHILLKKNEQFQGYFMIFLSSQRKPGPKVRLSGSDYLHLSNILHPRPCKFWNTACGESQRWKTVNMKSFSFKAVHCSFL